MKRRDFLKSLSGAGLCTGSVLTGGCHYFYMAKAELEQTNEMFIQPFRRKTFLTWNITAGLGLDGKRDLARIAAVIKEADVGVTAVQKIDRKTARVGGVDQFEQLSDLTGLQGIWCTLAERSEGEVGMAFYVKDEPAKQATVELAGDGRMLVIEYPAFMAGLVSFPSEEKDWEAAVAKIVGMIDANRPFFLLGDWGDEPQSPLVLRVRRAFAGLTGFEKTYPADEPQTCRDYIALSVRHRLRFDHISHEVLPESVASDHRPVKVSVW